ncbi:unnamed protein product [Rhizoctonia solani]|nr:unnamed protein product [Rhizoctonia solani]
MPDKALPVLRRVYPLATAPIIVGGVYEWTPDDPGPNMGTYDEIIIRIWDEVTTELDVDVPYQDPYGTWITQQLSAYRNRTKGLLASVAHDELGLKERFSKGNAPLVDQLLPDGFHTAPPPRRPVPFFSNYIIHALKQVAFSQGKYGIRFPELFNPFPLQFMAYVATMSSHVINCHANGYYDLQKPLKLNEQANTFRSYLEQLVYLNDDDPELSEEYRTQLYDVACLFHWREKDWPPPKPSQPQPTHTWRGINLKTRGYISKYPTQKRAKLSTQDAWRPDSEDERAVQEERTEQDEVGDEAQEEGEETPSDPEHDLEADDN